MPIIKLKLQKKKKEEKAKKKEEGEGEKERVSVQRINEFGVRGKVGGAVGRCEIILRKK